MPSGLFPIRTNLELWILQTVGRTPWTGDHLRRKAATQTGQQKHRRNADRHPCLEWDSNARSQKKRIPIYLFIISLTSPLKLKNPKG
jgi:hypothetical protein